MKSTIVFIGKAFTVLATWVSHISLRGFVIIFGVILALTAPRNALLEKFDSVVLTSASYLFKAPLGSSGIAIVEVPREEITTWQSDIHSSGKLAALLSNVLNSPDTVVALLLQQPIDTGAGAADALIEQFIQGAATDSGYKKAKMLVDRKFILLDLLKNDRVVVGIKRFIFAGQRPLLTEPTFTDDLPFVARYFFWPPCAQCFGVGEGVTVARPAVDQHTVIESKGPVLQALYLSPQGEAFSGFFIQLLRTQEGVERGKNLVWNGEGKITVGQLQIPVSTTGEFIPVHTLSKRMEPIVNTISLNEALARSAFPGLIFIAGDGDPSVQKLAHALYSVRHQSTLFSPWWAPLLLVTATLVGTLYLGFIATRMTVRNATIVSMSLCALLLITQVTLMLTHAVWVPLALAVTWLFGGHFLLLVWSIKKHRIQHLVDRADDICIARARQLIDKQELDEAYAQLGDCSAREPLLQTMYDICEAFTEHKNYAKAVEVLGAIQKKQKHYKDTEQKLQVLTSMLKTVNDDGDIEDLQQTMVIESKPQGPRSIGRYRLEKEIGRGAMGQVYLGFDPRISRRVAVKTLNYDNFNGKERQEIKTRFFREAEAAGRLSHPSIVSVFDVGEENDLAFIAMDFAVGKPLNNFVSPDNLLPVFEVYRIICDVATALEYAHENNIVHRDVKPGNIIYNPSPYQIKVTDFGIARLTDNSKTSTGEILGSPLYMAPEQLKGKKVNRAADIFSLGVTFYQLLTGQLPYQGDNLAALTYEIIHGRHKGVRSIRKELPMSASRITNQALQKDPADRYETAAEMALILKKAIKRDFAAEAKKVGYI